jgi:hypothetical protein
MNIIIICSSSSSSSSIVSTTEQHDALEQTPSSPALLDQEDEQDWLNVARLSTDYEDQWLPEMLHYNVEQVPCLVLLDRQGSALCRTNRPRSLRHMEESLAFMVEMGRASAAAPSSLARP